MVINIKIILIGFFLIFLSNLLFAENNRPVFKQIICSICTNKNNPQKLSLYVADNEHKRSYGLMNRKDIKSNSGMLFIWEDRQIRHFWMKNTHFNLDLYFLDNQGKIIEIYKNANAFDETIIKSRNKVNLVVELKSGRYPLIIGDKFNCPFKNY